LNEALLAFCEDQLSVADLPRSMELSSAVRETLGLSGGGGSSFGGGGFLQPTAAIHLQAKFAPSG